VSTESPRLRFEYEWEPAEGVQSRELAATWCRLEIWVGSDCVTRVEDRVSGSTRRSLYCSLYALAEWIAFNWWAIQAHVRPTSLRPHHWSFAQLRSNHGNEHGWLRHHNLRAAGDGFLWPNMTILPEGSSTRLTWVADTDVPEAWPIRFVSGGECVVNGVSVLRSLGDLVDSVITRLAERGVQDSTLLGEWRANAGLSGDEREFCLAAARLGLDPYSTTQELAEQLVRVSERLDEQLLGEFLDAADPLALDQGLRWIDTSSEVIRESTATTDDRVFAVRVAVDGVTVNGAPRPWTAGYHQAARARQALGLEPTQPMAPEEMMAVHTSSAASLGLQGLGGESSSHSPTLVLGAPARLATTTRFAAARALWHFAIQPERERFLLTPTRTDVRRIERAFAAELLAPAVGLREQFMEAPGAATDDDLDAAAAHYGVSPLLIRHQIENQLLAT